MLQWYFFRSRKYKSKTGKPKSVRGGCLGIPTHFGISDPQRSGYWSSVSAVSDSASAETSQYSIPQVLRHLTSHRITIVDTVSLRKIDLGPKAESISTQKEHLDLVEAKSISTQADEGQDQDLGSWKLSEVITRYSRCTPVDGNLNVWPSLVHHYRPSKAISEAESVRLHRVHPKPSQSDSIASKSALSRDHVGFVSTKTNRTSLCRERVTLTILTMGNPRHLEEGMGLLLREKQSNTHTGPSTYTFYSKTTKFTSHLFVPWCFRKCLVNRGVRMTRKRNSISLHLFDHQIEKTLNRIRKSKNMHIGHSSNNLSLIPKTNHFEINPDFANNPLFEPEPMEDNNRTLKELAMPDVLYQP
ncbi:hypothetical protein CR513_46146, partial [Mucuna pruriens]